MAGTYASAAGLDVAVEDAVLRLAANAPERRNALNDGSVAALIRALEKAGTDDRLRAVLLEGTGTDFCNGFDILAGNAGGPLPPSAPRASPAPAASSAVCPSRRKIGYRAPQHADGA